MAKKNAKADQIGDLLQDLAYHDLEVFDQTDIHISKYDHLSLIDEKSVYASAEKQTEQHLQRHHGLLFDRGDESEMRDDWCFECTIEAITLLPEGEGREIRYKGSWKLLGDTDGAEGQNRTGYAGLFRAALYR